ncbi:MAG: hypothetical protein SGPRY_013140 [Prymnesium sp.]
MVHLSVVDVSFPILQVSGAPAMNKMADIIGRGPPWEASQNKESSFSAHIVDDAIDPQCSVMFRAKVSGV